MTTQTGGSGFASPEERLAVAQASYEHIMTTPAPDPGGAFTECGVVGFVFGEMWRRGVLTPRDRRMITIACVGASGAPAPMETHTYAALNSGELTVEELDEAVMFFGTQMGWPRGSELSSFFSSALSRLAEERGGPVPLVKFEPWAPPAEESVRRARGEAAYEAVHGVPSPPATTAFRKHAYLDFLYGEVWTRAKYLTNRDRRLISICCSADLGVAEETTQHLEMALRSEELSFAELQEVVVHVAVYLGWLTARRLDDLLVQAAESVGVTDH